MAFFERIFTILIFLLCSLPVSSQFQVLFAREVLVNDQPVFQKDSLSKTDTITLQKDGFLSMIHPNGQTFEFKGEQQINLDTINLFLPSYRIAIPSIDEIYFGVKEGNFLNRGGMPITGWPPIEFLTIDDDINNGQIQRDSRWCFRWKLYDNFNIEDTIFVTIKNLYDDIILRDSGSFNHYELDFSYFNYIGDHILVEFYPEKADNKRSFFFTLTEENYQQPLNTCEPSSATASVLIASILEQRNHWDIAEIYFQKATNLSDEKVFRDIYESFLKRKK